MSNSPVLDVIAIEIEQADYATAMEGGGSVLAFIGAVLLKKLGYGPIGKAEVTFDIDKATTITITWPGEAAGKPAPPDVATEAPSGQDA